MASLEQVKNFIDEAVAALDDASDMLELELNSPEKAQVIKDIADQLDRLAVV